jgi:hypothetical protein
MLLLRLLHINHEGIFKESNMHAVCHCTVFLVDVLVTRTKKVPAVFQAVCRLFLTAESLQSGPSIWDTW